MALVDYSDSDPDVLEQHQGNSSSLGGSKRKRSSISHSNRAGPDTKKSTIASDLPPLPAAFHDLYASSSRVSTRDDPALHGGRQRVIPHVEGNWATHIYLEWYPDPIESTHLSSLISTLEEGRSQDEPSTQSLLNSDLGTQLPLHISLSRPVTLVTEQRQPFIDLLEEKVSRSGVRPFNVSLASLDWVPNYENTRWFLVLRISKPANDGLNRLLRLSNQTILAFGQPPLYAENKVPSEPPQDRSGRGRGRIFHNSRGGGRGRQNFEARHSREVIREEKNLDFSGHFHISIGWSLEAPSPAMVTRVSSTEIKGLLEKGLLGVKIRFETLKAKLGNAVTVLSLPTKVDEGKGLLGL
ncbi:MAG: poly(U)-specific 3'-to-5' RNA exonuclease [Pycnora praestabilis]|nr:MAG: poly(U)-specific 3'-to-5' RNA exonuclease [Pycnora praestabilis]